MLENKLLNIQFAKYHIWNNKSEGFPNMVLSTETFNQSVRTEYSEAVNARYTFLLRSNQMLVFEERGKLEYPEKNLSEQSSGTNKLNSHVTASRGNEHGSD